MPDGDTLQNLRDLARKGERLYYDRSSPDVDQAALDMAQRTADRLGNALDLRLTPQGWTQFKAIIQIEAIVLLKNVVFEPPSFPKIKNREIANA